ncbi:hypothetical protein HYC85_004104 [Camellia sinensis]|uniref:FBD domain-containing protein n=1 Tax=Camellia sinensis TaxID=4442 RepID=A0A7J7HW49_CAMSI|nr:hypothetical protein HYC85_004104 [Camellia sinensis]
MMRMKSELIKYLLKHAKSLERMTIFYSPHDISRSVKIISQKLEAFTKASSAGIYFRPC